MLRTGRMGLVLAGAITLSACGDKVVNPPPPPPPPPPPVQETIVIYGDNGPVPAESGGYIEFTIPGAGTVEATVDWTFASSIVFVAMTTAACDDFEAAFLGQCSHIGTPNLGNSKPKTVSGTVTQGGPARLWLLNGSEVDESMAVQITLTRTRSASAPVIVEPFARSWVPVSNAAVQVVRAFKSQN
jgi:hypothetical protein